MSPAADCNFINLILVAKSRWRKVNQAPLVTIKPGKIVHNIIKPYIFDIFTNTMPVNPEYNVFTKNSLNIIYISQRANSFSNKMCKIRQLAKMRRHCFLTALHPWLFQQLEQSGTVLNAEFQSLSKNGNLLFHPFWNNLTFQARINF